MDKNLKDKKNLFAGAGLPIGAALGFIFGMLLFDNLIFGAGIGAALGLIIGAIIDGQRGKEPS
jgi:uncharacterized membrane protein